MKQKKGLTKTTMCEEGKHGFCLGYYGSPNANLPCQCICHSDPVIRFNMMNTSVSQLMVTANTFSPEQFRILALELIWKMGNRRGSFLATKNAVLIAYLRGCEESQQKIAEEIASWCVQEHEYFGSSYKGWDQLKKDARARYMSLAGAILKLR